MNDTPSLLRSAVRNRNHWVEGTKSNRSAIGARMTCIAGARSMKFEVVAASALAMPAARWISCPETLRRFRRNRFYGVGPGHGRIFRLFSPDGNSPGSVPGPQRRYSFTLPLAASPANLSYTRRASSNCEKTRSFWAGVCQTPNFCVISRSLSIHAMKYSADSRLRIF